MCLFDSDNPALFASRRHFSSCLITFPLPCAATKKKKMKATPAVFLCHLQYQLHMKGKIYNIFINIYFFIFFEVNQDSTTSGLFSVPYSAIKPYSSGLDWNHKALAPLTHALDFGFTTNTN